MKNRNKYLIVAFLALVAAATFYFISDSSRRVVTTASAARTKVRFATSYNAWCGLPIIAMEKGYFDQEGIEIDLTVQPVGKLCVDALRSSSVDIATAVEVNFAYVGFDKSNDLRLVTTIVKSDSSALVARRSSGISKPEDLAGKSVALIPGTTTQMFAHRVLQRHNISAKDVTIRSFQPNSIVAALVAKDVDCASLWEPLVGTAATQLGDDAIIFLDPDAYTGFMAVAVRRDWGVKNKATIQRFVKALERALDFLRSNPAEAQAVIARRMQSEPEVIARIWKYFDFRVNPSQNEIQPVLEEEGKWIKATQDGYQSKDTPPYSMFFDKDITIPATR